MFKFTIVEKLRGCMKDKICQYSDYTLSSTIRVSPSCIVEE